MRLFFLLISLFSLQVFAAELDLAPPSFSHREATAVFVDFQSAQYNIKADFTGRRILVQSTITFKNTETGFPLFDLVPEAIEASLDDTPVKVVTVMSPNNLTTMKSVDKTVEPGTHVLKLKHYFFQNTTFELNNLNAAFFTTDLVDRQYMEKYLPTNLEYDHYAISVVVDITGSAKLHKIYANGDVQRLAINKWAINFPAYFSCSSMFLHVVPNNDTTDLKTTYTSLDGRVLPVLIYSKQADVLGYFKLKTLEALQSLEADFGPFPHPQVIIYGVDGSGGMEFAGATISGLTSVSHELAHSYFGRGIMAATGNSGWIDEAVASWRDKGYLSLATPDFASSSVAGHSPYVRRTDTDAYSKGASFIAYLNDKMSSRGGFLEFSRVLLAKYVLKSIDTPTFQKEVEDFLGYSMAEDFAKYIYTPANDVPPTPLAPLANQFHRLDRNLNTLL